MKFPSCLPGFCVALIVATPLQAASPEVLAICGDSITYQKQYSVFMQDYLTMCQPIPGLRVIVSGNAGETSSGLSEHMENDVMLFKPTVMTTLYGMNDGKYLPLDQAHLDSYEKGQTAVIAEAKKGGVRTIILGSPTCVDPVLYKTDTSTADVYNNTLKKLGEKGHEIADKNGIIFADVNTVYAEVMARSEAAKPPPFKMNGDGVHPLEGGHLVITDVFLKALGCTGAIGTISVDMASGEATGTPGQKIISSKDGTVEVESTRYPFCFWGNPDDPNTTVSVLKFLPFNQDLNRYLLVVKNMSESKAKVTWGAQTKEFSSAELAKGINLAAEFIDNPFVPQFQKVEQAIQAEQNADTDLLRQFSTLNGMRKTIPGSDADIDQLIAKAIDHEHSLGDAANALVIPIQHTIKIEPES